MAKGQVRIAVDAMGGDHAPTSVIEGVQLALGLDPELTVLLVGLPEIVGEAPTPYEGRVEAVPATETIGMDEEPVIAVRTKRDSSLVVGSAAVRDGRAEALVSAGNSGAAMAASTLVMGRIEGVSRPAIAAVIPTSTAPCLLLDVGANTDCKPEHLLDFGLMGTAYSTTVLGVSEPSVALLSIGEEQSKGSQLTQAAYPLLAERLPGFVGHVEGRDIPTGSVDVVVTDGFTGNVALKLMEGVARELFAQMRAAAGTSTSSRIGGALLRPALRTLRDRLDPDTHGGAPLLGVDGVMVIAHGDSGPRAIAMAIAAASRGVRGGLTELLRSMMA
jgi:glycerol-3-phosphate acyltransferase PlsX